MPGVLIIHLVKIARNEQGGEKSINTDAPISDSQLSVFSAPEASPRHFVWLGGMRPRTLCDTHDMSG